ncbi:MAG: 16S rRNA (guanine(527)-N(7))-methyltransferase RsmG [Acholeplasmataceae bacterium]|nr:16S rRNA (guanine(527)-N(7))-methyltransferase RsmG [Acholeplasmataceae bacterium]
MTFLEALISKGKEAGLVFTEKQLEQFSLYFDLLIETNKVMNLTAITEPEEVAVKHIIDSLLAYDEKIFPGKLLADVGTGAGFPGIPLKIYCPELKVVLLDSLAKRLKFLQTVIERLGLEDISCVHLRAEDAGQNKDHREKYDLVTARAVARLSVLSEYCLPLVKQGGYFIAMKGSKFKEEITEGLTAVSILGGEIVSAEEVKLPGLDDGRAIIKIRRIKRTPAKYPRKAGLPEKQPL